MQADSEWAGSREEVRDSCRLAHDAAVSVGYKMTLSFLLSAVLNKTKKLLTNCGNEMFNEHYRAC